MAWSKNNYPDSMKNLDKNVREKAIEIANSLYEKEYMDEGRSISIAIAKAKEWADKSENE
jgi:uncharacterized protein YdaT